MTPAKTQRLIKQLRRSNRTLADACRQAGLNRSTLYRWADGSMVPTEHKFMDFKRAVEAMTSDQISR